MLGTRDGFGGGESEIPESLSLKNFLSAQGDRVGSLVMRQFRPRVFELAERESLVLGLLGSECVENFKPAFIVSAPAERVIRGDWITPSALLHFSWDILEKREMRRTLVT